MTYTFPIADVAATAAKVKAAGGPAIDPAQTQGTATTHGVTLTWILEDGQISIAVDHKPWYVSWDQIKDALDGFFGGAK